MKVKEPPVPVSGADYAGSPAMQQNTVAAASGRTINVDTLNLHLRQILLGQTKKGGCDGRSMWHVWGKRNGYSSVIDTPVGKRANEYLGVDGRIILMPIFKKIELVGVDWINLAQVGKSGGLL